MSSNQLAVLFDFFFIVRINLAPEHRWDVYSRQNEWDVSFDR